MNVNNNTTSAIVDSLFRLVRDGLALRGPFGARHRGAAGATGKLTALYAFGSLSRCFSQIKSLLLSHHHSTSALVSEILESVLQTVQKNKTIYI